MTSLYEAATVDLSAMAFATDRTSAWKALRDAGEVVNGDGEVIVTSANAVEFAAKRPDLFSSARVAAQRLASPVPLIPIGIDPPDHSRFRRILDPFFGPRRMAEREADLRAQVGVLIDSIAARESCDVMRDLAIPFPSQVFLTLFGLPLQDRDRLLAWNDALLELTNPGHADPDPRSFELGLELFNYLSTNITERREGSSDRADLLTQLVHDGTLTDEEVLGMCFIIVVAGLDTVTSAIGFSLARLASDSKMRQRICADPSVIPAFIEEILRVDAPIPFVARLTNEDVEVAGTTVPKDTIVLLSVGSAGRDPRRFSDAEQIRLNEREAHFAFGRGPHRCLGSHLARMELRLVLEEWHARIPEYSLASSVEPEIIWPRGILAYSELPLALGTA